MSSSSSSSALLSLDDYYESYEFELHTLKTNPEEAIPKEKESKSEDNDDRDPEFLAFLERMRRKDADMAYQRAVDSSLSTRGMFGDKVAPQKEPTSFKKDMHEIGIGINILVHMAVGFIVGYFAGTRASLGLSSPQLSGVLLGVVGMVVVMIVEALLLILRFGKQDYWEDKARQRENLSSARKAALATTKSAANASAKRSAPISKTAKPAQQPTETSKTGDEATSSSEKSVSKGLSSAKQGSETVISPTERKGESLDVDDNSTRKDELNAQRAKARAQLERMRQQMSAKKPQEKDSVGTPQSTAMTQDMSASVKGKTVGKDESSQTSAAEVLIDSSQDDNEGWITVRRRHRGKKSSE